MTSSADVGSSAISSCGPARQTDGDQRTLTHAAGQLMRVPPGLFRRIRHAGLGEQLHRPSSGLAAIGVGPQRFPDLEADLPDRVEVGHRVLGHVADLLPRIDRSSRRSAER